MLTISASLQAQVPTITSFTPASATQRDTIVIKGSNFTNVLSVTLGGASVAKHIVENVNTIKAVVGYTNSGELRVNTLYGTAIVTGFTYTGPKPPKIASFSPAKGPSGTLVTISGSNFNLDPAKNQVHFGKIRAAVTGSTTTSITVRAPASFTQQPISVTTNDLTAYSISPFTVTFPDGGIMLTSCFDSSVYLSQAEGHPWFTTGDVDGDGKIDILGLSIRTAYIYKNTSSPGKVSFAAAVSIPLASNASSATLGDLNGDGLPDLVATITSGGSSRFLVYKNTSANGTIQFSDVKQYPTGITEYSYPERSAVMDFDNDGRPDLVIMNHDYSISVFKNTSNFLNIMFAGKKNYFTEGASDAITLGDFDGDNKFDIVTANPMTSKISFFKNISSDSNVNFAPTLNIPAGYGVRDIAAGDLNEDGKPDLAMMNIESENFGMFENISAGGTLQLKAAREFGKSRALGLGDLDGDGKPDMIGAYDHSGFLMVHRNNSSNGSLSMQEPAALASPGQVTHIGVDDIDGDGLPDLITSENSYISIKLNRVPAAHITGFSPVFGGTGTTVTIRGYNMKNVSAVSFGGRPASSFNIISDTLITAVVGNGAGGQIKISAPTGDGYASGFMFNNVPIIHNFSPRTGNIGSTVTITGANFNTVPSNNIVYFGTVTATVISATANQLTVTVPFSAGNTPISVTSNKLTGYSVLPFNTTFPGALPVFMKSSFEPKMELPIIGSTICVADFDNDGKPDILSSDFKDIFILRNNSQPARPIFTDLKKMADAGGALSACDFDGDGKLDLISARENLTAVYRNISTPGAIGFAPKIELPGCYPHTTADLDQDGKPDIAALDGGMINVFKNISGGNGLAFSVKKYAYTGSDARGIEVCDYNNDGRPELVVTRSSGDLIELFPNKTQGNLLSFGNPLYFFTGDGPVYDMASQDADGDGKPDLWVKNYNGNSVGVLRNIGSDSAIAFAAVQEFTTARNPDFISVGDIDGDGRPDAVVTHQGITNGKLISLLKNTGVPGISFADRLELTVDDGPVKAIINDLDGDGKPDLLVARVTHLNIFPVSFYRSAMNEPLIAPSGANPVTGAVINTVMVDSSVQTYNGQPYVQRHYKIEPVNNPSAATANVTLYFSQEEFDRFNTHPGRGAALPANSADVAGIANIRIFKYQGFSATSVPGSFPGGGIEINPADSLIVWDAVAKVWKISFAVSGFSDFFVSSAGFTIAQPAALTATTTDTTTVCQGNIVKLMASVAANYQWYKNGVAISSATSASYQATTAGSYTVTTSVNNIASLPSNPIMVTVKDSPAKPVITALSGVLTSNSATGNQWYRNGIAIDKAINQVYKPDSSGSYTVKVKGANNCMSVASENYNFVVTSIVDLDNNQFIRVSPNPVVSNAFLRFRLTGSAEVDVQVIDMQGKLCRTFNRVTSTTILNFDGLPNGIYILQIISGKKIYRLKLMKL